MNFMQKKMIYAIVVIAIVAVVLVGSVYFSPIGKMICGPCGCLGDQCTEPPTCSDGTIYGSCSSTKPNYCRNGIIISKCSNCGCPSGQSCNTTSQACYTPTPTCSDGTLYGQCSSTKPKFCNSGALINNCSNCGCPSGQSCNTTSQACYTPTPTCSDGTLYGQCSSTKPKYCAGGTLIDNCTLCGCLSGQTCNITSLTCYTPSSFDFNLSANPKSGTAKQGNYTTLISSVTTTLKSGSTQSVQLSVSNCPASMSCLITPSNVNPTFTSTLVVNVTPSTPLGIYSIIVNGVSSSLTRSTFYNVTVS